MQDEKEQLRSYLKELLLSENEIAVYFACLEIGEASIVPIRNRVNLPRTTVFRSLENLRTAGVIDIIETPNRRMYVPYPPKRIATLLANLAKSYQEKADEMKAQLPDLNKVYNLSPFQPKVRYFVGEEIESIYNEILEEPIDELLYIGEIGKLTQVLTHKFFKGWVERKVKKGIATRSIRVRGNDDPFFDPRTGLRKARLAPMGYCSPAHVYIYHNSVATITSARENFGVVITSKEFATTMKNTFRELWKASEEIK